MWPFTLDDQGDSLSDNVTVQMSHPGIIIQTVTSEDLPDPLNQSELTSEQDLANEETAEGPENAKEGDESSEQSSKVMQEDSTDKVLGNLGFIHSGVVRPNGSTFLDN